MKRRAFLGFAGLAAGLGLPLTGTGAQDRVFGESAGPISKETDQEAANPLTIRVVGIGGAGKDAIERMKVHGAWSVEFVCLDPEVSSPDRSSNCDSPRFLRGLPGVCIDRKPALGSVWAQSNHTHIIQVLNGADLVFIIAGMGGAVGTGAAPVVAEVARKLGIHTVAVVTTPFAFDGKRVLGAQTGLMELCSRVEALIVVSLEELFEATRGENVSLRDLFRFADDVMMNVLVRIARNIIAQGPAYDDFNTSRVQSRVIRKAITSLSPNSGIGTGLNMDEKETAYPLAGLVKVHYPDSRVSK